MRDLSWEISYLLRDLLPHERCFLPHERCLLPHERCLLSHKVFSLMRSYISWEMSSLMKSISWDLISYNNLSLNIFHSPLRSYLYWDHLSSLMRYIIPADISREKWDLLQDLISHETSHERYHLLWDPISWEISPLMRYQVAELW